MWSILLDKFKEVLIAVFPIVIIVLILNFTVSPIETAELLRFILGALFVFVGLSIFLFGIDIGIYPIGKLMGNAIIKVNKILIVVGAVLILSLVVIIAEPDLHIFGGQIDSATAGAVSRLSIILAVSIGMAIMMTIGFIRVIYNIPLNVTLTVIYGVVLVLSLFVTSEFLAFSFDAAGAATGALSVPFILALSRGISSLQKDSEASENNSFGLLAVTLPGAILGVMVMSLISNPGEIISESQAVSSTSGIILPFLHEVPNVVLEILFALSPIFIMYLIFEKRVFKLSKTSRKK